MVARDRPKRTEEDLVSASLHLRPGTTGTTAQDQHRLALVLLRAVHTAIWFVYAVVILALPIAALVGHFRAVWFITGLVALEGIALGLSGGRCPLTSIAERLTPERGPTIDIYLPRFIARWNLFLFTPLLVLGEVISVVMLCYAKGTSAASSFAAFLCVAGAASAAAFLFFTCSHWRKLPMRGRRRHVAVEASALVLLGLLGVVLYLD